MRGWQLAVDLRGSGEQPIFIRLARAISDDVRRGRLRPGDALPGSRSLARDLGVHRNTVLAAYAELAAEGWVTTAAAAGTFVSRALPEVEPTRAAGAARVALPARLGFDLNARSNLASRRSPPPAGLLTLSGGVPDVRLLPTAALARAYRRALKQHGPQLLGYGDARGHARLRRALGEMLSALRGVAADEEGLMVTRGSQLALYLVGRALLGPGDVVAVEALGYRPAWTALAETGARLVPVPVDAHGIDVDALEKLAAREPLRAVYVTPHHQYPTTVMLAAGRRLALLELARARRIAVIEDDYDFEFHYEGRPVLPLASTDRAGIVVYVGTLSKILAPSLRLGFVVAPAALIERLAELRMSIDRQGDQVVECAVAELIEDGELQRHVRRMRRIYLSRREALVASLHKRLGGVLSFSVPPGGMALWAQAGGVDVDAWAERSLQRGAVFHPGRQFAFDGRSRPALRLGFAALTEAELDEGVRRIAAGLRRSKA
ncbi:MAG: GntR family transcriptional regulator [Myxococcales bacterium]|nr:GntR family transcriptional regulator [Myxococcales bacterium]